MKDVIDNLNNIYKQLFEFLNNIPFYRENFPLIKEEYRKIIKNYIALNKELNFTHPLEYFYLFTNMLNAGYLSYAHKFTKTTDKSLLYDISYHYELDVINGYANCRHIATMFNDILEGANFNCGLMLVNISESKYNLYYLLKRLEKLLLEITKTTNKEEKKELLKEIKNLKIKIQEYTKEEELKGCNDLSIRGRNYNHVINVLNFAQHTYFLDATINNTYKFNGVCLECFYDKSVPLVFGVNEYHKFRSNQEENLLKEWLRFKSGEDLGAEALEYITNKIFFCQDLLDDFYNTNAKHYNFIVKKLQRYKK